MLRSRGCFARGPRPSITAAQVARSAAIRVLDRRPGASLPFESSFVSAGLDARYLSSGSPAKAAPSSPSPSKAVITPRAESFHKWYSDVIGAADLIDYSAVRGCMILKPRGYALWEAIKERLDRDIKRTGHSNAYFPLLLPLSFLSREAAHVEGFAQECAVVTHHRVRKATATAGDNATSSAPALEPDPSSSLQEPLVIRPTSETIIWDAYRRWISTHKDLPLLLNQWANVMRWEMRTRPFLRTSEFLWQEGHTAHASEEEARKEASKMAVVYKDLLESFLAVPVVLGQKSQAEKFAGAVDTMTCEAMMGNGWALQAATSHFLGTNFAKAFDVQFTDAKGERKWVWATSWGASTRLIGAVIMSHGDDAGLVLPPSIAPTQVGILPIAPPASASAASQGADGDADAAAVVAAAKAVSERLRASAAGGLRVSVDEDVRTPPGARFYALERSGCPLRIEIGKRDLQSNSVTVKTRIAIDPSQVDVSFLPLPVPAKETPAPTPASDSGMAGSKGKKAGGGKKHGGEGLIDGPGLGRIVLPNDDSLPATIANLLQAVQAQLKVNAMARLKANTMLVNSYEELVRVADECEARAQKQQQQHPQQADEEGGQSPLALGSEHHASSSSSSVLAKQPSSKGQKAVAATGSANSSSSSSASASAWLHPWFVAHLHDDPAVDAKLKEKKLTVRCFPFPPASPDEGGAEASNNDTWKELLEAAAARHGRGHGQGMTMTMMPAALGKCTVTGKEGCRLAIIARAF